MAQWGLGMDRFALSKLENVTNENPTIDTLLRCTANRFRDGSVPAAQAGHGRDAGH
jgi:hypothetical protein